MWTVRLSRNLTPEPHTLNFNCLYRVSLRGAIACVWLGLPNKGVAELFKFGHQHHTPSISIACVLSSAWTKIAGKHLIAFDGMFSARAQHHDAIEQVRQCSSTGEVTPGEHDAHVLPSTGHKCQQLMWGVAVLVQKIQGCRIIRRNIVPVSLMPRPTSSKDFQFEGAMLQAHVCRALLLSWPKLIFKVISVPICIRADRWTEPAP